MSQCPECSRIRNANDPIEKTKTEGRTLITRRRSSSYGDTYLADGGDRRTTRFDGGKDQGQRRSSQIHTTFPGYCHALFCVADHRLADPPSGGSQPVKAQASPTSGELGEIDLRNVRPTAIAGLLVRLRGRLAFPEPTSEFAGRQIVQGAVRPAMVVVVLPTCRQKTRFFQASEGIDIQKLVTHSTMKGFDPSVFPG